MHRRRALKAAGELSQTVGCNVVNWISVCAGTEMRTYLAQPGARSRLADSLPLSPLPIRQGLRAGTGIPHLQIRRSVLLDHDAPDRPDLYDTAG